MPATHVQPGATSARHPRVQRVAVVGLGYVGLPTAVCLARAGYLVTGADISARVVDALKAGVSPLRDSIADETIREVRDAGALDATQEVAGAVSQADFVIVCVPTPVDHEHKPDLGPLRAASAAIGRGLRPGVVVSYESTTFPGCTERECIPLLERESGLRAGEDFGVAYCPERLNPGDSEHDAQSVPRVLAALDERSLDVARRVYASFLRSPLHICADIKSAEAAKVLENVQRDVNIALVNEFAAMCPALGLDAHAVLEAARTKFNFVPVEPGPGVGGHCIPVDPYYLIEEARRAGFEPALMATARRVNDAATERVAHAILRGAQGRRVAVLGLSYKRNVGDLRESPSLRLVESLRAAGCDVAVHDPLVEREHARRATGLDPGSFEDTLRGAHAVAIMTDHDEYRGIHWASLSAIVASGALLVDGRNCADPAAVRAAGWRYWGIGRGEL